MSRNLHRLALNLPVKLDPYPLVLAALAAVLHTSAAMAAPETAGVFLSPTVATRASVVSDASPVLDSIAPMIVPPAATLDQTITAHDPDGDPLTFAKVFGPAFMTVTTILTGPPNAQGIIHLAPSPDDIAVTGGSVLVSDGFLISQRTFAIRAGGSPPVLADAADMDLNENTTEDQILTATDADGDSLVFALSAAPTFASLVPVGAGSARLHLAPGYQDAGEYSVTVTASDGRFLDTKTIFVSVWDRNRPPVLAQPSPMRVDAGETGDQTITAEDADGTLQGFFLLSGPWYVQVTTTDQVTGSATGNIHVAPLAGDAPVPDSVTFVATATIRATDGFDYDQKAFSITTFFPVDHPPMLDQPPDITMEEDSTLDWKPQAADPDGDQAWVEIVSVPSFVSGGPSGLHFAPGFTDSGDYVITLRAIDTRGLTDEKTFHLHVGQKNAPPLVRQPALMIAFPGQIATQEIQATDLDGDPLTFEALGPSFLSVATLSGGTGTATGEIRLAPSTSDVGIAVGDVAVTDGLSRGYASFPIEVHPLGIPVLVTIPDACLHNGAIRSIPIRAVDPEGSALTLTQSGLPSYGTFVDHGDGTAIIDLEPGATDTLATNFVIIQASDGVLSSRQMFAINLAPGGTCPGEGFHWIPPFLSYGGNNPPIARVGGPYTGVVEAMTVLDGSQSSDAEHQPLRFGWSFGDGLFGVGPAPAHTYSAPGTYTLTLFVSDGSATSRRSTTVQVADAFPARAFDAAGPAIKLWTREDRVSFQVEPVGASFATGNVVPSSMVLKSASTGLVDHIAGAIDTLATGDHDGNGVQEITASFAKEDLRQLFGLMTDRQTVTATLEGRLATGGIFRAPLPLTVQPGPFRGTTVYPNPLNPVSTLSFQTTRPGQVRILLYQTNGRQVGILYEEKAAPAGGHYVPVGDIGAHSMKLPSGVYFYRIETVDGVTNGRFVVLK